MTAAEAQELDWAMATRALPGQIVNGDHHLVVKTTTGWLLAVADGLGHGPQAAAASNIFIEILNHHFDETPVNLVRLSHEALIGTRGIACTIMSIDSQQHLLSWVGVGNVEGVIRHQDPVAEPTNYVTMRGGVVGYRLPALQPSYLQLLDGDILALATDGIASNFVNVISANHSLELLANRILNSYAKSIDDALVLVARWRARPLSQGG